MFCRWKVFFLVFRGNVDHCFWVGALMKPGVIICMVIFVNLCKIITKSGQSLFLLFTIYPCITKSLWYCRLTKRATKCRSSLFLLTLPRHHLSNAHKLYDIELKSLIRAINVLPTTGTFILLKGLATWQKRYLLQRDQKKPIWGFKSKPTSKKTCRFNTR